MATALSIVQDVLGEIGITPLPTDIASSTDARAITLRSLLKASMEELARKNWPVLLKEHTFDTVDGTSEYNLPADFGKFVSNTAFDRDEYYKLRGSMSPEQWQFLKASGVLGDSLTGVKQFRISSYPSKFKITPTPSEATSIYYEYLSSYMAVDDDGVEIPACIANTDVPKFDASLIKRDLKWRYLKTRGFDYAEDFREAKDAIDAAFAAAIAQPNVELGGGTDVGPLTDGYVPTTGYGS
jgi:hypothetical protein